MFRVYFLLILCQLGICRNETVDSFPSVTIRPVFSSNLFYGTTSKVKKIEFFVFKLVSIVLTSITCLSQLFLSHFPAIHIFPTLPAAVIRVTARFCASYTCFPSHLICQNRVKSVNFSFHPTLPITNDISYYSLNASLNGLIDHSFAGQHYCY